MNTSSQPGRSSGGVPPWEPPTAEELSSALPAYEVTGLLGRGGMGAVYRAVQRSLKRIVAIKVLPRSAADDELKFAERFRHEAETLARLNHPGIVHIHDFGETADGLLYLVMEFVDGTDVHRLIQGSGRLSEDYALAVTAHVCDALAYAHSRGIVHRDIKPANVLIDQEGNVKVADFGLAKMTDPKYDSGLTMSNVALGTPDYVAPEVLSYGMEADHRADLYAVGVMLYQMLTGEVPRGLFKLPSQRGLVSDTRWDEIICRALEADRDERYQSAVEVRQALDAISTGVVAAPVVEAAPKAPPRKATVSGRRHGLAVGGIILAAVAAAFATLALVYEPPKDGDPPVVFPPVEPVRSEPPAVGGEAIDWLNAPPAEVEPWAPAWNLRDGVATVHEDDLKRQFGRLKDGSIRIRVGLAPDHGYSARTGPQMQLDLRSGAVAGKPDRTGHYQFQVYLPNRVCTLHYQEKDAKTGASGPVETLWDGKSLQVGEVPDEEVEWVFRVEGERITATADGVEVCSVRDARVAEGYAMLTVDRGTRITVLETTGLTPVRAGPPKRVAAEPPPATPMPSVWDWQDVTDLLRDRAAADSRFLVEPDAIREAVRGKSSGLELTPPEWTDLAVWVRFTSEAQVNLRASEAGFVYILCQRHQLLFHRYEKGVAEPFVLAPPRPHPAGYDATNPHEMLVTLEGDRIRVWLDGHFAGEARDDSKLRGVAQLMWKTGTGIHKVEVAELRHPAGEVLGESFWGQVGSVNAGRKIEIVAAKLEEINEADVSLEPTIEGGKVTALKIFSKEGSKPVPDLSPLAALTDLKILFSYVTGVDDLAWLRGLPVNHLQLERGAFADLGPIRESQVKWLDLDFPVKPPGDYSVLAGMPLQSLSLQDCPVGDLSFLSGMPLDRLLLKGTGITDHAVLKSLPLVEVELDLVPERDLPILLSIPTLKKINGRPVEEYRQPAATAGDSTPWTDWLGPRLADPNQFQSGGWIREDGGVTTDQPLKGTHTFPDRIRDGAVRVTFEIRDSEGVILDARQTVEGPGHHRYAAQYTGKNLYIAHSPPDATQTVRLVNQPIPEEIRSRPEHTLEFRFVGEELTAVLDGEIRISTRHSRLQEGLGAIVLTKGVLVKKLEIQALDPAR